jgi:hypothetical protein
VSVTKLLNTVRWPNRDPLGEAGGLNLYAYVVNGPINKIDSVGLATVVVITDGGGIGSSWAAGRAAQQLGNAGWTVVNMTPNEFINNDNPIDGLIMAGHGTETMSTSLDLDVLKSALDRTGSRLSVAVSLSCHGYDYVSNLSQKGYTTPNALTIGYWGYSANSPIRQYFIASQINNWTANQTSTTASYGNLIQDGLGTVGSWFASAYNWASGKIKGL